MRPAGAVGPRPGVPAAFIGRWVRATPVQDGSAVGSFHAGRGHSGPSQPWVGPRLMSILEGTARECAQLPTRWYSATGLGNSWHQVTPIRNDGTLKAPSGDLSAMKRCLEEMIRALAHRQHGVATRAQLIDGGMTRDQLTYRLRSGRFRRLHRGVYLVGSLPFPRSGEMAAALACGPGAVISHRSAAKLLELLPHPGPSGPVHVTLVEGDRGRRPGLRPHRVRALPLDEITQVDGVPVTSAARTLVDMAGEAEMRELERAFARAERRGRTDLAGVERVMARRPHTRGVRRLRSLLGDVDRRALTRSEAEERLLDLVRKARLPSPEVNVPLAGYEVDFLWRGARLVLEMDGFAYHSSRASFEQDRRRDASLSARGFRVIRITWRQVTREPEAVLARLAQALVAPSSR